MRIMMEKKDGKLPYNVQMFKTSNDSDDKDG